MLDGLYLTLLIGPLAVPVPAPPPLMEALESVQVSAQRERTGFQLTFSIGTLSPLQGMLAAGLLDPMITRVVIIATLRGLPHVICDGVVTNQQLVPNNEPGQSTLTLTGDDLSVLMDVIQMRVPWPAVPDYARINLILARYAMFGITPIVIPSPIITVRSPIDGFDFQNETDLNYINYLASQCGYTFYLESGPAPLQSLAYFGPDLRIPVPQPALSINTDGSNNVDSLSFSLNGLSPRVTVITILDPITRRIPIPVPLPSIDILKPPLGARPTVPSKVVFSNELAKLPPDEAAKRAFGLMREGADSVTGNGSLKVMQYGHILKARMLVGVRGAGLAYDGLYYVDSVTHNIRRGEYTQSFTLSRDGLISPTPVLPPGVPA